MRDLKVLEMKLDEYRLKAKEMIVGVNFVALNEERKSQECLHLKLRQLKTEIGSSNLGQKKLLSFAQNLEIELDQNAKCLKYLTGISELEHNISDAVNHFAERSVGLSDPDVLPMDVYKYKTLTDNVYSCWEYVEEFFSLAQIHLKSAAQYHQFFQEANELEAKMKQQLIITQNWHSFNSGQGNYKETFKLANKIHEQLDVMRGLWKRSIALVERSEHIAPMKLRMGGVQNGIAQGGHLKQPVIVRAMVCLKGSNYKIRSGEQLLLIDNCQNAHLWTVQTATGSAEVPAVCFWLTGNDSEAMKRAVEIKQMCRNVWIDIVEKSRLQLHDVYTEMIRQLASEKSIFCTNFDVLDELLEDICYLLIEPNNENNQLRVAMEKFKTKIFSKNQKSTPRDLVLHEADLVGMRAPLLCLTDHIDSIDSMNTDMELIDVRIAEYLEEVESERRRIFGEMDLLSVLTEKNQKKLDDLHVELNRWKRASSTLETAPKWRRTSFRSQPGSKTTLSTADTLSYLKKYRSKSQPRMNEEDCSSFRVHPRSLQTTPFEREHKRSEQLDLAVQVGQISKNAKTQYHDTGSQDKQRVLSVGEIKIGVDSIHKSTQYSWFQLERIKNAGTKMKENSARVDEIFVSQLNKEMNKTILGKKSLQVINDKKQSLHTQIPKIEQVNSSTIFRIIKENRACSPIKFHSQFFDFDSENYHIPLEGSDHLFDTPIFFSNTEYRQSQENYQVIEEVHTYLSKSQLCKRVQAGYPNLSFKKNMYCQIKTQEDNKYNETCNPHDNNLRLFCQSDGETVESLFTATKEAFYDRKGRTPSTHLCNRRVQCGFPRLFEEDNSFSLVRTTPIIGRQNLYRPNFPTSRNSLPRRFQIPTDRVVCTDSNVSSDIRQFCDGLQRGTQKMNEQTISFIDPLKVCSDGVTTSMRIDPQTNPYLNKFPAISQINAENMDKSTAKYTAVGKYFELCPQCNKSFSKLPNMNLRTIGPIDGKNIRLDSMDCSNTEVNIITRDKYTSMCDLHKMSSHHKPTERKPQATTPLRMKRLDFNAQTLIENSSLQGSDAISLMQAKFESPCGISNPYNHNDRSNRRIFSAQVDLPKLTSTKNTFCQVDHIDRSRYPRNSTCNEAGQPMKQLFFSKSESFLNLECGLSNLRRNKLTQAGFSNLCSNMDSHTQITITPNDPNYKSIIKSFLPARKFDSLSMNQPNEKMILDEPISRPYRCHQYPISNNLLIRNISTRARSSQFNHQVSASTNIIKNSEIVGFHNENLDSKIERKNILTGEDSRSRKFSTPSTTSGIHVNDRCETTIDFDEPRDELRGVRNLAFSNKLKTGNVDAQTGFPHSSGQVTASKRITSSPHSIGFDVMKSDDEFEQIDRQTLDSSKTFPPPLNISTDNSDEPTVRSEEGQHLAMQNNPILCNVAAQAGFPNFSHQVPAFKNVKETPKFINLIVMNIDSSVDRLKKETSPETSVNISVMNTFSTKVCVDAKNGPNSPINFDKPIVRAQENDQFRITNYKVAPNLHPYDKFSLSPNIINTPESVGFDMRSFENLAEQMKFQEPVRTVIGSRKILFSSSEVNIRMVNQSLSPIYPDEAIEKSYDNRQSLIQHNLPTRNVNAQAGFPHLNDQVSACTLITEYPILRENDIISVDNSLEKIDSQTQIQNYFGSSKRLQIGKPPIEPNINSWLQCTVLSADMATNINSLPPCASDIQTSKREAIRIEAISSRAIMKNEAVQIGNIYSESVIQTDVEVGESKKTINRKVQTDVGILDMRRSFNVSCDVSIEAEMFSRKIQCDSHKEQAILIENRAPPVFALIPISKSSLIDVMCDSVEIFDTSDAQTQLFTVLNRSKVQTVKVNSDISLQFGKTVEKMHNKKNQINLNEALGPIMEIEVTEPAVLHSAPPLPANVLVNFSCSPISTLATSDIFTQVEIEQKKAKYSGKKLQVNLERRPLTGSSAVQSIIRSRKQDKVCECVPSFMTYTTGTRNIVSDVDTQMTPRPRMKSVLFCKTIETKLEERLKIQSCVSELNFGRIQIQSPRRKIFFSETQTESLETGVDILVKTPEKVVHSAPPVASPNTVDRICEVVGKQMHQVHTQTETNPEPTFTEIGKKLETSVLQVESSYWQLDSESEVTQSWQQYNWSQGEGYNESFDTGVHLFGGHDEEILQSSNTISHTVSSGRSVVIPQPFLENNFS